MPFLFQNQGQISGRDVAREALGGLDHFDFRSGFDDAPFPGHVENGFNMPEVGIDGGGEHALLQATGGPTGQ